MSNNDFKGNAPVKLLDGGFSSQLSRNINTEVENTSHPLWCARFLFTDPGSVVNTHRDYIRDYWEYFARRQISCREAISTVPFFVKRAIALENVASPLGRKAGADLIITNTYQASVDGFHKYFELSSCDSYRLIQDAVFFVKRAIALENVASPLGRKVQIAGSVGSYGACLHDGSEYRGDYVKRVPLEVIKNWHRPRISALVEAGVDFLALETIPALAEAEVLVELLREFPNQKAWVSFTCKDGIHTAANDDITQAARKLWLMNKDQLIAIGVNCLHPSLVSPLITSIRNADTFGSPIPTIAYPNNGEHFDTIKKRWTKPKGTPPVYSYLTEWLKCGVSIIGGCCKTTADDISKFKTYVDDYNRKFGF